MSEACSYLLALLELRRQPFDKALRDRVEESIRGSGADEYLLAVGGDHIFAVSEHPVEAAPGSVAGVAAGTCIRRRPILVVELPRREEAGPLEGTCLPSCSRTDVRSVAQPVGSFVTKASLLSPKVLSNAPVVVGKSEDSVRPVT